MSAAETLPPRTHNNPPEPIEMIKPIVAGISAWLAEHPVIEDQVSASKAAALIDTVNKHLADLEDDRTERVRPLNAEVKAINASYKAASSPLNGLKDDLKSRATAYARAEEDRRRKEAEQARLAAEEAARKAREAELAEIEARDNAAQGEIGVDIGAAVLDADAAARDAARAERAANIAERGAHVRMKSGNARALSLRTVLVFEVTDPVAAMIDLPLTDAIRDAIISAARIYHKEHGKPPAGVTATEDRRV
ncbi:putative membrane protein YqiK [Pseudochelatococcus lubricantis]|uniref:Membrane protein YqiK n=1 Tax=Pseudochelatococcus lubricantis TaxID=1538102 RepID=A0ABX0UZ67_9HYPH|nr:hypothetical protein [Pseudochelatococcus lubricantis]NIJ57180.1 putative membrane protein YqiK [Pseudochelatococcus lubricantis]